MDRRQRQRVADIIFEEWFNSDPPPSYLDSAAILGRMRTEGEDVSNEDLLDLLDGLEGVYTTQRKFLGSRRIEGVDPSLRDAALN